MSKSGSTILRISKYVYLIAFFLLLAGVFHPVVTGGPADAVVYGTLSLLLGLGAALPLFKAASDEKHRLFYLGVGVGLIALSLLFVFIITGRI